MDSEVRREGRFAWLKTAGLAVVAMAVVLIAGGIAVTAQRSRVLPAQVSIRSGSTHSHRGARGERDQRRASGDLADGTRSTDRRVGDRTAALG